MGQNTNVVHTDYAADQIEKEIENILREYDSSVAAKIKYAIQYTWESLVIQFKAVYFRITKGFWPREWYSLDRELCVWLSPRLKYYIDNCTSEIDEKGMTRSYESILAYAESHDMQKEGKEGVKYLSDNFEKLWD